MGYHLGIDVGTTFTAAAIRRDDRVEMLGLGNRALQIPSVVFVKDDGGFLVGDAAETRGVAEPAGVVREFKRRLGDPVPILVRGTAYSPQALIARLLAWVVAVATERQGEAPESIVVSHPANWGPFKLDLLRQAFQLADLTDVSTCTEPEAAAITYASRQRVGPGECIAVYDLGGGTFDATVLRNDDGRFTLLGTPEGIEHLGGIDFDEAIFQHVLGAAGGRLQGLNFDDPDVVFALGRLRRDCVLAKETLSSDTDTTIAVVFPGVHETVRITRSELEDMLRPTIEETVGATRRVLRSAGVDPADLSAIVLVGGSSRIPLVSEVLSSAFGRPLAIDTHPKHDVAMGAALFHDPRAAVTAVPAVASPPPVVAALPIVTANEPPAASTDHPAEATAPSAPTLPVPPSAEDGRGASPDAPTVAITPVAAAAPTSGSRRRPAWIWGAVAAAVAVAVAAGVVLATRGGDEPSGSDTATTAAPSASSGASSASSAGSAVPVVDDRPVSDPLANDIMAFSHVDPDGQQGMWLMRSDGTARVRITPPGITTLVPAMSKDRRTLAYVRPVTNGQQVHLIATDGTGDRALFSTPPAQCPNQSRPAFSPNGRDVAIMCVLGASSTSIVLTDLLGNISATLAAGFVGNPTFSPDGTKVAYWATTDGNEGNSHLETVTVDAAHTRTVLTTGDTHDNDPCWSPDGSALVFSRVTAGAQHVWTISLADRSLVQVTASAAPEHDPSWSPDSTRIAYLVGGDTSKIWIVDRNGTNPHAISTAVKMDGPPEWASR